MPINPFDPDDLFTCPRCGSHAFHMVGSVRAVCEGPDYGDDKGKGCDYEYVREPESPHKEPPAILVDSWWSLRNAPTMLVRVCRVLPWPAGQKNPNHQWIVFISDHDPPCEGELSDTMFLEFYRPHSQPGAAHESDGLPEAIKTDSRDAATIAFDEIVHICDMKTWEYPGQVVRDVQILKDQRDAALDVIEETIIFSPPDSASSLCPWCETWWKASRESLPHALDCKAALLLRNNGRKVRFQGEP